MDDFLRVFARRKQIEYLIGIQNFLYAKSREYYLLFFEKSFDRSLQKMLDKCNGKITELVIEEREEQYREVNLNIDMLLPIHVSEVHIEFKSRRIHIYDSEVEIIQQSNVTFYRYRLNSKFDLVVYRDNVVFVTREGYREYSLNDFDELNKYLQLNNSLGSQ